MSKDWPKVRLGEVLHHRKEFVTIDDLTNYRRPRVRLHAQGIMLRDELSGALIKTKTQQVCRSGEFLVAEIDAKVGGFGMVPDDLEGSIVSSHYFLFGVDESKLNPRFLDFYISTPMFREQVEAQGSTNYAAIRATHVLGYEIPLPSLTEQDQAVCQLEHLSAQINDAHDLRQQSSVAAEVFVYAQTSRLFDQLISLALVPMRCLGIDGGNPIQTGPFGAQLHSSEFVESGVPVLNVGNVWPGGLRLEYLDHVLPAKADQLQRYALRTGDLLFARSGATLGKVCLVPEECDGWLISGQLFRVRFDNQRIESRFAFAALREARSIQEQIFGQVRGATRPGFNTTLLGNVKLPLPTIPEQRRIVAELDALQTQVDELKRLQSETASELDAMLPALLDSVFNQHL